MLRSLLSRIGLVAPPNAASAEPAPRALPARVTSSTSHLSLRTRDGYEPLVEGPPQIQIRSLTADERELMIGSGYRWINRRPGGSAEHNRELQPYRARGWRTPGKYQQMRLREPVIEAGLERKRLAYAGQPWRISWGTNTQQWQVDILERALGEAGGLPHLSATVVDGMATSGYALYERAWLYDGPYVSYELGWLEPWQVHQWITDELGWPVGAMIWSDRLGTQPVSWGRLSHFARRFTGRNMEGVSQLRSLWYLSEAKRRLLASGEIAAERFGEGLPVFSTDVDFGSPEYGELKRIAELLLEGQLAYYIETPDTTLRFEQGGSVFPPHEQKLRYLDHQMARVLGDTVVDLGQNAFGSRAVGESQLEQYAQVGRGELTLAAAQLTRELVDPLWRANGWPRSSAPTITVRGFGDPDRVRLILDASQQGALTLQDEDREHVRRELGLETDRPDRRQPALERAA